MLRLPYSGQTNYGTAAWAQSRTALLYAPLLTYYPTQPVLDSGSYLLHLHPTETRIHSASQYITAQLSNPKPEHMASGTTHRRNILRRLRHVDANASEIIDELYQLYVLISGRGGDPVGAVQTKMKLDHCATRLAELAPRHTLHACRVDSIAKKVEVLSGGEMWEWLVPKDLKKESLMGLVLREKERVEIIWRKLDEVKNVIALYAVASCEASCKRLDDAV